MPEKNSVPSCNTSVKFPEIDVVIVGAGLSGLVTAYKLLSKESTLKILILEADDTIGGQMHSSWLGELGGTWITADQYHIYNLCRQLEVSMKPRSILRKDLRTISHLNRGTFAFLACFETRRFIREIDLRCELYRAETYRPDNCTFEENMERYICSKVFFEQSRNFLRTLIRIICGVEAQDIKIMEFMQICYSSGNLSNRINTITAELSTILEVSSDELLNALEKLIGTYYIVLGSKVRQIIHYTDYVIVTDDQRNQFCCSVLILAIGGQQIQRLAITPPLPHELCADVPDGRNMITSFIAEYPEGYWRNKGYSGLLIDINPHMVGYELRPQTYGGFVCHDECFEVILKPVILKKLAEYFGSEMQVPSAWVQRTHEQHALLGIAPNTPPWNRIVFASSSVATVYRGFLGGAVQSGLRAAIQALLIIRPQTVSWEDIDEIHKANVVRKRINRLRLFFTSFNFYNAVYYSFVGVAVVLLLRRRHCVFKYFFGIK